MELVLDSTQVFPDDPGAGTPAMVYLRRAGREVGSATYWCAIGEAELDNYGGGVFLLSPQSVAWLEAQESKVDKLYEATNA